MTALLNKTKIISPFLPWLSGEGDDLQENILLCFPYAGGGVSVFWPWRHNSVPRLTILPVQLPGREERLTEAPYNSMDIFLEDFIAETGAFFKERRIFLFGHSMGAMIATAFARHLLAEGISPAHLFVSGAVAPHHRNVHKKLHKLGKDDFWRTISDLNGTPEDIYHSQELADLMEPRLRADLELAENWLFQKELNEELVCNISVLSGISDPLVNEAGLQGWRDITSGNVQYHSFSGDHFFLRSYMPDILKHICAQLIK